MKRHLALVIGLAVIAAACTKEQPAAPESAVPAEPAVSAPADELPDLTIPADIVAHMHEHARQLDTLNLELANGNLEAAQVPAYWLSRHDTAEGIPADLQPFVFGMRRAAEAVEMATDLETARAAAEEITAECQGCHVLAGV